MSDFIRLLRPSQWIKNGFVFIGVLFAHAWGDADKLALALNAFVAFCMLSSCVYVMNDILDRERDREHPRKCNRPIARGAIGAGAAATVMVTLGAAGLALALWRCGEPWIFVGYLVLNVAYSLGLKNVVILDVFFIAAGFMLRLLAGTLGIGIAPSQWLLLCGLLLTLFLGFAKRRAEMNLLAGEGGSHRRVLEHYSETLLDQMITVAAAGTLVAYSLYTVSPETVELHGTTNLIYTVPFVLYGMFRYLFLLHRRGGGGDPALEMVRDPHLVVALLGWLGATLAILGAR
jgi:4-hydroxybenzoate polyprenyltransferase